MKHIEPQLTNQEIDIAFNKFTSTREDKISYKGFKELLL
jgi:hypothetical protein